MLRSLYSGVSGMKVNQTKMDVIGNNIANVGTTSFKAGRTRFQDMLSQNSKDAMAPMPNTGGVNPSQVGLGVQLAGIDTIVTQGMMQPTGSNLDFAIDGDGYFMVGKGPVEVSNTTPAITVDQTAGQHVVTQNNVMDVGYTRDGSFTLDSDGNLLTSDGMRVLGYSFAGTAPSASPTAGAINGLNFSFGQGAQLNGYNISVTNTNAAPTTVTIDPTAKTIKIDGDITNGGPLSASTLQSLMNAELAKEGLTQTITLAGAVTAAGASAVTGGGSGGTCPASKSLGGIYYNFGTGTALNGYKVILGTVAAGTTDSAAIDTNAKTITINGDYSAANKVSMPALQAAINNALSNAGITQTINVGGAGAVTATGTNVTIAGGTNDNLVHSLDGSATNPVNNFVDAAKPLASDDGILKTLKIPDQVLVSGTPGTASAVYSKIKTFSISKEGMITGVLDDGKVTVLGQMATASFKNPAGLSKLGKNLYTASSNSGDPTLRSGVGTAATNEDNSKGYGDIAQGMLEMSNVDLAEQFTEMITTTRAFEASSKMINTGDEMLQDIINLKR